jgi:hypothetical protein
MSRRLSKSQYVKGRRCLKRLWLYNYQRDLAEPPSLFQEGILRQGKDVGELARTLFPGGELIDEDHTKSDSASKRAGSGFLAAGTHYRSSRRRAPVSPSRTATTEDEAAGKPELAQLTHCPSTRPS